MRDDDLKAEVLEEIQLAAFQAARDACREAINSATAAVQAAAGEDYHGVVGQLFERELKLQMIEAICEVL